MTTTVGTIAEIRRYPVKSMQGERIDATELTELGIVGDRAFAVRDIGSGKLLSAKLPRLGAQLLSCSARFDTAPTRSGIPDAIVTVDGSDYTTGDPALDVALSKLLGLDARVERATPLSDDVYESYWPEIDGIALSDVSADFPVAMATKKGTFADLAALHLIATASFDHLGQLVPDSQLSFDRFRPGIVIRTEPYDGFVEKTWADTSATLGAAALAFGIESPRCIMTTVAQAGLPKDLRVLQTLAKHNRVEVAGFGNFACLGLYAEVTHDGAIKVGDDLVITMP